MGLRSFNPVLKKNLSAAWKLPHQYGFKNFNKAEACQQLLDHLKLPQKYPNSKGRLDIIDVFSGHGLLSTMINYELKPRNHLIIDDTKDGANVWDERMALLESETGNEENFRFLKMNGYAWETYDQIISENIISPSVQPRSHIHDELLIIGNLTSYKTGESLFAQWVQCCACENWLQKYGRVRMLLLVREATSQKFLAGTSFKKRNRTALKMEVYTESKLVAISDALADDGGVPGESFDPNILVKDQPVIIPTTSITPHGGDLSVVEVLPRSGLGNLDVNALDHIAQILMYRSLNTVAEELAAIAPGAAEDLGPQIPPEILSKVARQLTREDLLKIYEVYNNWAFKPSYEETLNFLSEETRSF